MPLREGPFLGPTRFRVSGTTGYIEAGFPPTRRVSRVHTNRLSRRRHAQGHYLPELR